MKATAFLLLLVVSFVGCKPKPKYKEATGIKVTREPSGRIVSVPDSSRMDSL